MCLHIGSTDDGHFPPYLLNCTGYTENQLKAIIAVFTSASIISFLIGAFVFAVILYFKAHKTTLQRMFVYLVITTGIELTTFCLTIIHLFHYSGDGVLCESFGFHQPILWLHCKALERCNSIEAASHSAQISNQKQIQQPAR